MGNQTESDSTAVQRAVDASPRMSKTVTSDHRCELTEAETLTAITEYLERRGVKVPEGKASFYVYGPRAYYFGKDDTYAIFSVTSVTPAASEN